MVLEERSEFFAGSLRFRAAGSSDRCTLASVLMEGCTRPVMTALLQFLYTGASRVAFGATACRFGALRLIASSLRTGTLPPLDEWQSDTSSGHDAAALLEAAHFMLADEALLLAAYDIASTQMSSTLAAVRFLLTALTLDYGPQVGRILKLSSLARLLPGVELLEPDILALVSAAVRTCPVDDLRFLGLNTDAVDAAVDGPVTTFWDPESTNPEALRSPPLRQRVLLCVVNLRQLPVMVKWVDWDGCEVIYDGPTYKRVRSLVRSCLCCPV